jgi:chaperonin cofactor prefoldin
MSGKCWEDMSQEEQIEILRRDLSRVEHRENVLISQVNNLQSEVQTLREELSRFVERLDPHKAKT